MKWRPRSTIVLSVVLTTTLLAACGGPPAPTPTSGAPAAASLTIEEHSIIAADVDAPGHLEFLDHVPDEVLARRATWREFDPEQRASAMNEKLAPFGYRLVAEPNTEWQDTFYDLYRGEELLLSDLWHVWPVTVNESGTDFVFVARNGPNKLPLNLLVHNGDVQELDWIRFVDGVTPVYLGDDLFSVEGIDNYGIQYAVKRDDEIVYTYTASQQFAGSAPVVRLLAWEGHWILETFDGVIVDGESLSEQLGVDEIFHYIIFQGRPLFFFRKNRQIRISYDGEPLPLTYDRVPHYWCCEASMFNIGSNEHILWFYALKDETWFYVEIGVYDE
jgi:hypothetical protein